MTIHVKVLIGLTVFMLCGCSPKKTNFQGYLVAKEYTPEHMSDESVETYSYAVVAVPNNYHPSSKPHKIEAEWVWYIADKYGVDRVNVHPNQFNTKKLGDFVLYNY